MKDILMPILLSIGALFIGLMVGRNTSSKPDSYKQAIELCTLGGGEMLVTEFNSQKGLTMNCFYPEEVLGPILPSMEL